MISAKRLVEMARKWQKMAGGRRKRISYTNANSSAVANKGHFVVYSMDQKRFEVPLKYLSNNVFKELLKWSEEEFGSPSNGPITLPIDSVTLEYIMSLVRQHVPEDVEKTLISFVSTCQGVACSSLGLGQSHRQQAIIYGF